MSKKFLILIVLFNILPAAYAMNNPTVPHSSAAVKSTTRSLAEDGTHLNPALNSSDPYQYCFNNSTWVVPPQTLLAYQYTTSTLTPVSDQTVWVISNYNQGYFTGESYTAIDNSILSQRSLIGSVTTGGTVYITFYSLTSGANDLVTGLGSMTTNSSGQCSFTMQMNSSQNSSSGLTHWSYMIPVNPGDFYYNNLPGTGMDVPTFLAQF